jgi:hypothetical protein
MGGDSNMSIYNLDKNGSVVLTAELVKNVFVVDAMNKKNEAVVRLSWCPITLNKVDGKKLVNDGEKILAILARDGKKIALDHIYAPDWADIQPPLEARDGYPAKAGGKYYLANKVVNVGLSIPAMMILEYSKKMKLPIDIEARAQRKRSNHPQFRIGNFEASKKATTNTATETDFGDLEVE